MRLGPKRSSPPPEIKPQWDTAFQYAGPLPPPPPEKDPGKPIKNNVPLDRTGFQASPPRGKLTDNIVFLNPGASLPVVRDPKDTRKDPVVTSPAHQQFETLKYYSRNFPGQVSQGLVPKNPKDTLASTQEDIRAMNLFHEEVKRQDPEGKLTPNGEFGAAVSPNRSPAVDGFLYAPGRSVSIHSDKLVGSGYDFHSHLWDPNKPAAPENDPYSNVSSSRFPSFGDYLSASFIAAKSKEKGVPPPKFMMMTEGKFYQYYGDRVRYDRMEAPPKPPSSEAGPSPE